MNFIVCFPIFSAWVQPSRTPARRYAPGHTPDASLEAPGDGRPTHTPTEMSAQFEEHSHAKNVLPLWNPKEEANAAAWRFGYSVGRRIIHATLKTGVRPQKRQDETREMTVLGTILLIILILILIGSLPTWPYSAGWGYYPSSGLGLVVIIILILVLLGRI